MRRNIYFDWSIRDLIIRSIIHLHNQGYSKQQLDYFINYLIHKIKEDYNHTIAVLEVARMFERLGCTVILTELRNKLADLIVATPHYQLLLIEIKPTPPPWGGLNNREKQQYELITQPIYYVWKENNGWYYTVLENIETRNGKLYVKKKYPLKKLLELLSLL